MRGGGRVRGRWLVAALGLCAMGGALAACRPPTHDGAVEALRANDAEATAMADGLMAQVAPGTCSGAPDFSALPKPLGPFSEACLNLAGTTLYFHPAGDARLQVAFGAPPSSARACLREVSERWWIFEEHGDPDFGGCPDGWKFLAY